MIDSIAELGEMRVSLARAGQQTVLVPTMGALHAGHLSLIDFARKSVGESGFVMVSIFVNPIQFDKANDLEKYPRPLEDDLEKCRSVGVDVVFLPTAESMYHQDRSVLVNENQLSRRLCGASRPGHFDGVCTVVLKLFLLTGCVKAVFGKKDFQQLAIIRRMVRDLNLPVEILEHPTFRETDGLAMSSRNVRLNADARMNAPQIYRALQKAARLEDHSLMVDQMKQDLSRCEGIEIDYVDLVDAENLQPAFDLERDAILAVAVFFGDVRLIDHITIPAKKR